MGIRQTINEKPAIGVIIVVVGLLGAGVFLYWTLQARRPKDIDSRPQAYYFDPSTQETFTAELKIELPISRSPGGTADCSKVIKYTCGDCDAGPFESYLESYNTGPDGKSRKVVASWDAKNKWVDASSTEGESIQNGPATKCRAKDPESRPHVCQPKVAGS